MMFVYNDFTWRHNFTNPGLCAFAEAMDGKESPGLVGAVPKPLLYSNTD